MATIRKRKWRGPKGERRTGYLLDYFDNLGVRQRKQFPTRAEADAERVKVEGQLANGTYRRDASRVTVKEVCSAFLEWCEGRNERDERMTSKLLAVREGHVWNYIAPDPKWQAERRTRGRVKAFEGGIGEIKLAQLSARSVGAFRDRLRSAGVSIATTRAILRTLQAACAFAIGQDWVAINAAHGVKVIGPRDEGPKKIVPPPKEAVRRIVEAASGQTRLAIVFAAATGLRAGEQWAVRWRDVDLAAGVLHVAHRVDAYGDEGAPKTKAGERDVPLSAQLVAMLRKWKLESKFSKPEDLIFANTRGRYVSHDNFIRRGFQPVFSELARAHRGAPDDNPPAPALFNWHALRHFAVSCWIEAGLAPKAVQTIAGHSSLQVTMDRYGHMFPSPDHRKAMDAIAGGLFG